MSAFAAIILAAGRATRYRAAGGREPTKLLEPFKGEPLIRRVACAALGSRATPVIVVTGYAADSVDRALNDLPLQRIANPRFADGMATSLRCGLEALPTDCDGAVILLGDMPAITTTIIDRLIVRGSETDVDAVVPVSGGRRGNPVVLKRRLFPAAMRLSGDTGARQLLRDPSCRVGELTIDDAAIFEDMDVPSLSPMGHNSTP